MQTDRTMENFLGVQQAEAKVLTSDFAVRMRYWGIWTNFTALT